MAWATAATGTCNGDSGGPALMKIDGVETIVGVTSYGNADCSDGGFDARVDSDLAFIDTYLPRACARACDGRACGSDGCGGSCGSCSDGDLCADDGQCVAPKNDCQSGGHEQEPNDSALVAGPLCAGGSHGNAVIGDRSGLVRVPGRRRRRLLRDPVRRAGAQRSASTRSRRRGACHSSRTGPRSSATPMPAAPTSRASWAATIRR